MQVLFFVGDNRIQDKSDTVCSFDRLPMLKADRNQSGFIFPDNLRHVVLDFTNIRRHVTVPQMCEIRQTVLNGDIKRAISYCDDSPLPAVLRAGLQRFLINKEEVEDAMEEAMLEATPKLQKRTHYLSVVANIATLLGLLGTIIGLIYAFSAISEAEPGEKAIQLARGISLAMSTTAFGLIVAIPCLFFHSILQAKANKLLDEVDEFSLKAIHLMQSLNQSEED